jgi:hypothetical protein
MRFSAATVIAALALLGGCASTPVVVRNHENLLAAAGFNALPATTPQQQDSLHALPPNRLVRRVRGNGYVYLYADPTLCNCLYIGGQPAYDNYQHELLVQKVQQEEFQAELDENTWEPGPWGPGGFYP